MWGLLAADGTITPQLDRQGHFFEAARELGRIDFSEYLAKGVWDDTHIFDNPNFPELGKIVVGVPTDLEYHGPESELAKAHGKVGWWTEGHLFDPHDPNSWRNFTTHEPTARDLQRADYYWRLSSLLKGTPRDIGISAEGKMLESPCGRRIIWAKVQRAAVCEVPQAPASTLQPLELAVPLKAGMIGASPCDSCSCPAGACKTLRLRKSGSSHIVSDLYGFGGENVDDVYGDDHAQTVVPSQPDEARMDLKIRALVALVQKRFDLDRKEAARWVRAWMSSKRQTQGDRDGGQEQRTG